ncbi:MAG TPA: hypothetical protein VFP66_14265 [Candidatus Limnocylindrales bacterium]|nr:hypothetical protein [Candidatus Limnocylindrales bacterium]
MRMMVGALIGTLLVAGCAGATGSAAPAASAPAPSTPATVSPSTPASASLSASPSPSGAIGGTVQYKVDGAAATTEVDLVADGATVSGTAVTRFREGTHTVRLGCAARNGDTWALGGTTEQTTVPGERAGDWSAVIVKNGSPQQIAIWLSDDPSKASDCAAWLATTDFATIGAENFNAVESGALVPPPDLAP